MTGRARIGVVGGNGWLGSAMIAAALAQKAVAPGQLIVSSRSGNKGSLADVPLTWTQDNAELARLADIVVLSVGPAQFRDVHLDLSGKLVLSVMAGVSCDAISARTQARRIIRSMPNAAAAIGQSFTPWFATPAVTAEDKAQAQAFLAASGDAVEVPAEGHIDFCVGLSGSGAAFPALLAEAMIAEAVAQGIPRAFAARAAKGVVCGASQLFKGADVETGAIVKEMIDYRGTTAAALQAMIDNGFNGAVAAGLRAALKKAASIASDNT